MQGMKRIHRRRNAIKRLKSLTLALPLLLCMTMFSVGFSAWIITPVTSGNAIGGFEAYGVDFSDKFIANTNVEMFKYSSISFVSPDENGEYVPTSEGSITMEYTIKLDNCNADLASDTDWDGSLTVNIGLGYENLANASSGDPQLFSVITPTASSTLSRSIAVTVLAPGSGSSVTEIPLAEYSSTTAESYYKNNGSSLEVVHSFDAEQLSASGASTYVFSVRYTFIIPTDTDPANFRSCLGKYLLTKNDALGITEGTKFISSARILETE